MSNTRGGLARPMPDQYKNEIADFIEIEICSTFYQKVKTYIFQCYAKIHELKN
jgi:hypothetical protein